MFENRKITLEFDEVLVVSQLGLIRVYINELGNVVRVHVVGIAFVAGNIPLGLLIGLQLPSQDACPLAMRELATLVVASTSVAEVRALENVTLSAVCPLLTETKKTKRSADICGRGSSGMRKGTLSLSAIAFGIMQTVWDSLGRHLVRQVASIAVGALSFLEKVLTQGDLVGVVDKAALGAFGTRAGCGEDLARFVDLLCSDGPSVLC